MDYRGPVTFVALIGAVWWIASLLCVMLAIEGIKGPALTAACFAALLFACFFYFVVALFSSFKNGEFK